MIYLFDQYQRYQNARLYIEALREEGETFRILEVGANAHKNLKRFLPEDDIIYLDIEVPEELRDDPDYIQGDATQMTFEDGTFDVILALDVYEHIPPERRRAFLQEIARVSARGFVVCAPFDEEGVHEAECRVNANFKCFYGYDHPWLNEHIANGLPSLKETKKIMGEIGESITVFAHGSLDVWERMTNIEMVSDCSDRLREVGMQIHDYYNKELFSRDYVENAYRYFICGGKEKDAFRGLKESKKEISLKNAKGAPLKTSKGRKRALKKFAVLESNFWTLFSSVAAGNLQEKEQVGMFQMYYDSGEGMGVAGSCDIPLEQNEVSVDHLFSAADGSRMSALRIDPMIHSGIIKIKSFEVYDSAGQAVWRGLPSNVQCRNLMYHQGQYYLFSDDPQICLKDICCDAVTVKIDYEFWECPEGVQSMWQFFVEDVLHKNAAYNKRQTEQMRREHQREIQALHGQYQVQIQQIYRSTSWRITAPLRFLGDGCKKVARGIVPQKVRRGLYIILHEGFSSFCQRYSAYRHRKQAERAFMRSLLTVDGEQRTRQREKKFDRDVLISIIVPLYNTPMEYLIEMIESCQNQTYAGWELCLADGSDSEHSYVGEAVRELAAQDSRIKYRMLERNGGISENTNAALEMASGTYIALLDHDDLLHPAALYEYMNVICETGADFIYCDEMTFEGKLSHIVTLHFKPDFAVDNLRANNYICHFSVFSKELLEKAGIFRPEYDGSQDHDMILRLTEKAERIVHIPQILYFWRSHPASVASDINSKTYAVDAGKRAVMSHLERCGLRGVVESSWAFPTIFNVKYEIESFPKISVIIPNKDHVEMLSRCIDSIWEKSTYGNFEILVVENNSTEQDTFRYYERLEAEGRATVLYYKEEGFNYARINNYAAERAAGEYVLFLNNDIEIITPDWMQEMLMFAQRDDVGAVGAKLYYPDNTIQHAGVVIGMGKDRCAGSVHHRFARDNVGYIGRLCYAQEYSAVTAACLLISREIFRSVGGFDERFAVAYNDVDLCMAVREAGYRNIWTPCAEAYHYESVSRGYDEAPEKQERFRREVQLFQEKWQAQIDRGDPFYNRNLTLDLPDFSPRTTKN